MSKPNRKEEGSRKRHSDHHRHHSRHFSSSSSPSKSHHRHRNSNEKRTYRHQSPSPPRSSRKDGRHSYSRGSCRKSKFDSPSRESSHTHRHKKHRSRTPPRKTEVKNVKHEEAASTKVCNNSKPVKLESIQKVDPIKHMLPPAPPKQIVVPNLPDLSRFIENSHQLLANSSASKKSEQEKKRKLLWGDSKKVNYNFYVCLLFQFFTILFLSNQRLPKLHRNHRQMFGRVYNFKENVAQKWQKSFVNWWVLKKATTRRRNKWPRRMITKTSTKSKQHCSKI